MTATYTASLPTDLDRVRFLLGDTDTASPILQDEEITAVLALESNYWLAAWRCGMAVLAKWQGQSGGLTEKQVGSLRVRWGDLGGGASGGGYSELLAELRAKGIAVKMPRPKVFRSMG